MTGNVKKRVESQVPVRQEAGRDPFLAFRHSMDRLMDEFFRGFDMWPPSIRGLSPFEWRTDTFAPKVDVKDEDGRIVIEAELPGMTEKDVEVSLSGDSITIRGEKKRETEEEKENYYRLERVYGSFERTLPLPAEVETDKAEAKFKNGVLSVLLPKTKEALAQKKRIPIEVE
ncbi:Hsp20/alpha crystallin family protein [Syntrophorhabdus aromaticivorans]|jgi:HSP20 family protein|uniref:Hsp20/alpha crystallin family protein n=1 Tax=Syntrophorhabdus aromaticivorans TaxID=328301 RepID=UPI00040C29C0|nr:Hsp20/alpha crystallin family protein [Syntrophorhabdus aromaticivorans]